MPKDKITATLSLRMDFEGEWARKINKIKEFTGIQTTTDLIRYLLNEKYREIREDEKKFV
jgi:hypothetical protein